MDTKYFLERSRSSQSGHFRFRVHVVLSTDVAAGHDTVRSFVLSHLSRSMHGPQSGLPTLPDIIGKLSGRKETVPDGVSRLRHGYLPAARIRR